MIEKPAQPVDDRKPKPQAAAAIPFGRRKLIELAKNAAALIFRDADAAVPHLDAERVAAATATDHDASADGVANRVGYQIEENAFEEDEIAADEGSARNRPQPQALFSCRRRECHFDTLEQVVNRELRNAGRDYAGVELGNIQERTEQLVHRSY